MLNELQLENHYKGIGGSLASAILGFDKYTSRLDAYLILTDEEFRAKRQSEMGEAAKWGNLLEPVIANEAAALKNWNLSIVENTLYHDSYPFLIAHPDRIITHESHWEGLEIKTRSAYRSHEYGDEESDQVLDTDMIQCQHYMNITGLEKWHLVALIGGQQLRFFEINRDNDLIETMTKQLASFWNDNVLARKPPEPNTAEEVAKLYPRSLGKAVKATKDILTEVANYESKVAMKKLAEDSLKASKDKIACYLKDADTLLDPTGKALITFKTQERKPYTVNASSFRVMRLK